MKKSFTGIMIVILIATIFTSCLNLDSTEYTAEQEQIDLNSYLKNLSSKGYDVDTTAMGVYYITITPGTGDYPVEGDTVSIKYVGYLMDGSIFDTSFYASRDSSWTYAYKKNNLLASWDEITGLMNKGCKMEFILPSNLAYGSTGSGVIPPYASLIFVAIMKDIRKP